MRRFLSILLFLICLSGCQEKTPVAKYVFFFIGDGMGLGQVALAEAYQAAQDGKIGNYPLNFSQFPVLGTATTYSASNIITCSSAAGTALATGEKTNNGMLGVRPDTSDLTAITYKIKDAGYKVGVTSTVTLDHATPGAFYAHAGARSDYYSIAVQLPVSGFDFFGGGGFLQPSGAQDNQESVFTLIEKAGYTVAYGAAEFNELKDKNEKMILLQNKDRNYLKDLPYAIDREEGDLTQAGIVAAAIEFLDNEKGFFLMSEGGKIDWACHSNDGKTALMEVLDMADAVQVAIAFAQKHPDETLIVVTADHETGGPAAADRRSLRRGPPRRILQHRLIHDVDGQAMNQLAALGERNELIRRHQAQGGPLPVACFCLLIHRFSELSTLIKSGAGLHGASLPSGHRKSIQGLYMYGGVGCGKTMLMDLLVASAPKEFQVSCSQYNSVCVFVYC